MKQHLTNYMESIEEHEKFTKALESLQSNGYYEIYDCSGLNRSGDYYVLTLYWNHLEQKGAIYTDSSKFGVETLQIGLEEPDELTDALVYVKSEEVLGIPENQDVWKALESVCPYKKPSLMKRLKSFFS